MTPTERAAVAEAIAALEKLPGALVSRVCDLEDYTSPDDQPDLLQCTTGELEACAENSIYPVLASLRAIALASAPSETVGRGKDERQCTCHSDDNPPRPCPRKYALSECRRAAGFLPTADRDAIREALKEAKFIIKENMGAVHVPQSVYVALALIGEG